MAKTESSSLSGEAGLKGLNKGDAVEVRSLVGWFDRAGVAGGELRGKLETYLRSQFEQNLKDRSFSQSDAHIEEQLSRYKPPPDDFWHPMPSPLEILDRPLGVQESEKMPKMFCSRRKSNNNVEDGPGRKGGEASSSLTNNTTKKDTVAFLGSLLWTCDHPSRYRRRDRGANNSSQGLQGGGDKEEEPGGGGKLDKVLFIWVTHLVTRGGAGVGGGGEGREQITSLACPGMVVYSAEPTTLASEVLTSGLSLPRREKIGVFARLQKDAMCLPSSALQTSGLLSMSTPTHDASESPFYGSFVLGFHTIREIKTVIPAMHEFRPGHENFTDAHYLKCRQDLHQHYISAFTPTSGRSGASSTEGVFLKLISSHQHPDNFLEIAWLCEVVHEIEEDTSGGANSDESRSGIGRRRRTVLLHPLHLQSTFYRQEEQDSGELTRDERNDDDVQRHQHHHNRTSSSAQQQVIIEPLRRNWARKDAHRGKGIVADATSSDRSSSLSSVISTSSLSPSSASDDSDVESSVFEDPLKNQKRSKVKESREKEKVGGSHTGTGEISQRGKRGREDIQQRDDGSSMRNPTLMSSSAAAVGNKKLPPPAAVKIPVKVPQPAAMVKLPMKKTLPTTPQNGEEREDIRGDLPAPARPLGVGQGALTAPLPTIPIVPAVQTTTTTPVGSSTAMAFHPVEAQRLTAPPPPPPPLLSSSGILTANQTLASRSDITGSTVTVAAPPQSLTSRPSSSYEQYLRALGADDFADSYGEFLLKEEEEGEQSARGRRRHDALKKTVQEADRKIQQVKQEEREATKAALGIESTTTHEQQSQEVDALLVHRFGFLPSEEMELVLLQQSKETKEEEQDHHHRWFSGTPGTDI